jgi:vitamin B12 transporter
VICCGRTGGSLLLAVLGILPAGALAQVEELPPLLVSGAAPPPELSALDADALATAAAPALTELLRLLPGVHIDRAGAAGGVSSLYLRGAEPNFTAVFVDGLRINDPTNTRGGSVDLSTMLVEDLERVEVLRGPVSALYGADALAGAMNLVSARGSAPLRLRASLAGGDHDFRRAHVGVRGAGESFDYAAGVGHVDAGTATPGSEARLDTLAGNVGWSPWPGFEARATLRQGDAALAAFPEDSGGWRYAQRRELERRDVGQSLGTLALRWLSARGFGGELRAGSYRRDEQVVSPGVAPGIRDLFGIPASRSDNALRRDEAVAQVHARVGETKLRGGVHGSRESGRSDAEFELLGPARFALTREATAAFLDAEHAFGALQVEASARVERPADHGRVATPRARLAYTVGPATLSVAGGRGFKLPSFYALGHPLVGNPELRPERSRGAELGLAWALTDAAELSLAAFRASYRDAIDFEEGPPPRLVNRDRVVARGAEAGLRGEFGPVDLTGHVSYVDARIADSTERLRNRPRWTAGLAARYEFLEQFDIGAGVVHVGRQLDSSIPTGDRELAPWLRVDAGAGWRPLARLGVHLDVENALDADYDELLGFPGARRNVRVRMELTL